jgi:choline/glycine/proline betaine transport protein
LNHKARRAVFNLGLWKGTHPQMTIMAMLVVIAFSITTIVNDVAANQLFMNIKMWLEGNLGWLYILIICAIFFFCLFLMLSPFGRIRLGADNEKPEFSTFSWFAMLFSAGVGVGLLFWSIAEPIYHFQANPFLAMRGEQPNTEAAAQTAIDIAVFHWGLHAWAIYALTGLCLGYFAYRKGMPLTIRSALYPILGDRIYGPIGHAVDLLAVFATIFGVATTLGLGVVQINTGLNYLFGIDVSTSNQIIVITLVTAAATVSAVSGVEKGIKLISEWNIRLTVILLSIFLLAGPSVFIVTVFFTSLGDYLSEFISMGVWIAPLESRSWQGNWTIFYWAWCGAWAPFVGMFIARISRGRTIREYLVGAMVIHTLVGMLWLSIFGGTAMYIELFGSGGLTQAVNTDMTTALYRCIELLDLGSATWTVAALATFLLLTWFVTSADSGTLVLCTILSMGNKHPPIHLRLFWGVSEGLVTAALLLAGGIAALKSISIIVALPFLLILILMSLGLASALYRDRA